jgi:hypothetical protein
MEWTVLLHQMFLGAASTPERKIRIMTADCRSHLASVNLRGLYSMAAHGPRRDLECTADEINRCTAATWETTLICRVAMPGMPHAMAVQALQQLAD